MIPNNFVFLSALPLTPNGKVDRRALPDPDGARPDLTTPYRSPENDLERQLSDIWAAVLGLATVGIDDNFFELGGHSLQATAILARIKEACENVISCQEFFDAPTVARQAALLASTDNDRPAPRPALVKREMTGRIKLSYAQQRLWYLDQFEGDDILQHDRSGSVAGLFGYGATHTRVLRDYPASRHTADHLFPG